MKPETSQKHEMSESSIAEILARIDQAHAKYEETIAKILADLNEKYKDGVDDSLVKEFTEAQQLAKKKLIEAIEAAKK